MQEEYDVVIVGGGPAGSTAGALLAEHGRRVLILEREKFPRYRVGESLIPFCYPALKRLGLVKKMISSPFVRKYSVQFISRSGHGSQPFYFYKHIKHNLARTWQVERSEFDQMLLDNARDKGTMVEEEVSARELIYDGDRVIGVKARNKDGEDREIFAKVVVDASGRDAFAIRQNNWREADPQLNKVAVWTYYKGAKRDKGLDEGATTVAYIREKGWFWYLPLHNDLVSVGVVAEKDYLYRGGTHPKLIFEREIKENKWIEDHLSTGTQHGQFYVTGDYSYRSRYGSIDGLVLVGDALAFLDPVFSSGVFLALKGGLLVADAIHDALNENRPIMAQDFEGYGQALAKGIEAMRRLVYAFYDDDFNFGSLLKKYPHLHEAITDCLIGNVDRDFTELWSAVSEFAELPAPVDYGVPRIKAEQ
jgi:flavin-dependent dehydrogenase